MIKLRISTPDGRSNVIVEPTKTIRDVIEENNIYTEGATINLDGIPVSREEFNEPFDSLVSGESATLSIVVKTGNA